MRKLRFWIIAFGIAFGFVISGNLAFLLTKQATAESQKFSHEKKVSLIRQLIKIRVQTDPILKKKYEGKSVPNVAEFPEMLLLGLPETTIVTIVESYWMYKDMSTKSDKEILEAIERHRKKLFPESGPMLSPLTLSNYIRYRLNVEHSQGVPLSDEFIDYSIKRANEEYR